MLSYSTIKGYPVLRGPSRYAIFAVVALAVGPVQGASPYPPSTVITGISWDVGSYRWGEMEVTSGPSLGRRMARCSRSGATARWAAPARFPMAWPSSRPTSRPQLSYRPEEVLTWDHGLPVG